jgi:Arc/MetJ family transcription regulator
VLARGGARLIWIVMPPIRSEGNGACATHRECVILMCMPTNLAIDDDLLNQARTVGGYRTKRETVNEALREFIQRRQRLELARLAGAVDYDPKYDYKRERRMR